MLTTSAILTAIFIVNTFVCAMILATNPRRSQNKAFALFTSTLSSWILFVLGIMNADTSLLADLYIRGASISGALIPLMFYMLCVSIVYQPLNLISQLSKAKVPLLLCLIISIICCTPFFLVSVELPSALRPDISVPEATYGHGFALFIAYFPIAFSISFYKFFRFHKEARGVQRVELQFVLTAILLAVPISLLIHLAAVLLKSSAPQQFGPISIIPINLVIAYGIATHRILDVGTLLRKLTAYCLLTLYLIGLYLLVVFGLKTLISNLGFSTNSLIPQLLATIVIAFSMAPVHGRFQKVADKLVSSKSMDIPTTMKNAGIMFQSVTTIDALLHQFSNLLANALKSDDVRIFLANRDSYVQRYPKHYASNAPLFLKTSAVAQLIQQTSDPVSRDTMARVRQTSNVESIIEELQDLKASVVTGVKSKTELRGLVCFGSRAGGRIYDQVEQDALQVLCNQFAVALDNAQMYTEMQDSNIRNEIMLDQLISGVVMASPDRKITLLNHEAQRITGLSDQNVLGQDINTLPEKLALALENTLAFERGLQNTDEILFADEEEERATHVSMGSAYLLGHDESPMGALLVFTDMTEVKGLEEQVRRADQLSSVGTLAAGMAHEIKNPLVTIKTFTQLLPERFDDADFRRDFSSLVAHEVSRIDGIVNHLLHFSKPSKPNLIPMKLHETVEKTLELINEQLAQKNIILNNNLSAEHDLISGDVDLLTQTLVNFNLNAIEAIGSDGAINVASSNCHYRFAQIEDPTDAVTIPCIRLQISDTGKGIERDQIQKIFDPFFTSKSEGTGMGLSVAHGIIHEHHGAIEVDSYPGKGTTFSIYLPVIEKNEAA